MANGDKFLVIETTNGFIIEKNSRREFGMSCEETAVCLSVLDISARIADLQTPPATPACPTCNK